VLSRGWAMAFNLNPLLPLQIAYSRHRQQRQNVRHVILTNNNHGGFSECDAIPFRYLVRLSVSHPDGEWYAFANRGLDLISSHA